MLRRVKIGLDDGQGRTKWENDKGVMNVFSFLCTFFNFFELYFLIIL